MSKRTPPKRSCRECGGDLYSWTEAPLCRRCVDELRRDLGRHEPLRALARRLADGDRAAGLR